ncbi:hypothetical protein [Streptomyces sp. NPDC015131]|uniref:hypothetical protein n=1 Tax=Streptomyces sp. NPDC015131 TaxID=3364941 RepID=UPI0036F9D892
MTPEINRELFQKIHDQITMHPQTHDQGGWDSGPDICGTTRCVAGWAMHFLNPNQRTDTTARELALAAGVFEDDNLITTSVAYEVGGAKALGLTDSEAGDLFYSADNRARRMVELYALKGRDWSEDDL